MANRRRKVEVAIISDVHLGTYGCQAKELHAYLKSIKPEVLILNGDIIDIWQFSKRYWPKSHMRIVKQITNLMTKGTKIYYVTGNHDEMLRKFVGFNMGSLEIVNKVILELDGKKAWVFHGDVFDVTMKHSKWLAKLGAVGYDTLILLNSAVNFVSDKLWNKKYSFSKKLKESVKSAVKFIDDFEETAADIAINSGYDYVICGHIHKAQNRVIKTDSGEVTYLNSGDWVESLTALEYKKGKWTLYDYFKDQKIKKESKENLQEYPEIEIEDNSKLFDELLKEFNIHKVA